MLNRVRMDEESTSSDAGSFMSSDTTPSIPSPELEKLDINSPSRPSMSNVYGSSEDLKSSSNIGNSRPGTPARSTSSTSISQFFHRSKSSQDTTDKKKKPSNEDHLARWLQGGNVIYKSVGLGLMDLTVGMKVIEFAKEKGVGTHVEGF